MYNRYIPQSDGTYRRSRFPETPSEPPRPAPSREMPSQEKQTPKPEPPPCAGCVYNNPPRRPPQSPSPRKSAPSMGIGSFLKQLLPGNFDTEDLLVVLLLLLMAGDCQEDQNFALLTLALYLFL